MKTHSNRRMAILALVAMAQLGTSCKKDSVEPDVDAIPAENLLQFCRATDSVAQNPSLPLWPEFPTAQAVVMMLGDYANCGDTSSVKKILRRVRDSSWQDFSPHQKARMFHSLSLAYEIRGKLDVALGTLDTADSWSKGVNELEYGALRGRIRLARSRVLEKLSRSTEIVRLWGSECHGPGEEILARALRRELGVKHVMAAYQAGVSGVEQDRLHGELDAEGRFIYSSMFLIPETGERGIFSYFGPIRVRVHIGSKVCYLPAPRFPSDTSVTIESYLDHFAKTPFSQVLLGTGSLGSP